MCYTGEMCDIEVHYIMFYFYNRFINGFNKGSLLYVDVFKLILIPPSLLMNAETKTFC